MTAATGQRTMIGDAPTGRQQAILDFIIESINGESKRPPTIREICKRFSIASPNGVMCHLAALEVKGWLERDEFSSRGLRLTHLARQRLCANPVTVTPSGLIRLNLAAIDGEMNKTAASYLVAHLLKAVRQVETGER